MAQGHSVDDYIETIYFLAFPVGEYHPVTKGASTLAVRVADMLGVSRASAGEMLKRLEEEGLIERGEQKEAILTPKGRELAERVVRKHRIIERLLTDFMGYTAAESHVHADELGDTFTDDMIERIAREARQPGPLPARLAGGHDLRAGGEPGARSRSPTSSRAHAPRSSASPSTTATSSTGTTTSGLVPGTRRRAAHRRRRDASPSRRTATRSRSARRPRRACSSAPPKRALGGVFEADVHGLEAERADERLEHRGGVLLGAAGQLAVGLRGLVELVLGGEQRLALVLVARR